MIPLHKNDHEKALRAIEAGYPAVEDILPDLLGWLKDGNWPVAKTLAPFLVSIGEPILPHVRKILQSGDPLWIYWTLELIVSKLDRRHISVLRDDIVKLADSFDPELIREEVPSIASEIISKN